MPRIYLRPFELQVGEPVKWNVFDNEGRLLLPKGTMINFEVEKQKLLKSKAMRDLALPTAEPVSVSEAESPPDEPSREVRMVLDETRIQPGDRIQLQISGDTARFQVRLIGYLRGKSIIVTDPTDEGKPVFLKDGQNLVARVFSGTFVLAFPCTILASPAKPYFHTHLSYPNDILGVAVRKAQRVRVRAITAVESADGERGAGIITDMSSGGIFLVSRSTDFKIGSSLMLRFKLIIGAMEYLMQLDGIVKATRASDSDAMEGGMGYGIQLKDISAEDNLVLTSFVAQQLSGNLTA